MSGYIDLNRVFYPIPKDYSFDENSYDSPYAWSFREGKSWEDLLQLNRVIILAEAGAGKTEEIKHTTQKLREAGTAAFFLRLEYLADDFDLAFEEGAPEEFAAWLASDDEGWFFLDSVDEAKLTSPKAFERATRRFSKRVKAGLSRSHIFITSRFSEWRSEVDYQLVKGLLPEAPCEKINALESCEPSNDGAKQVNVAVEKSVEDAVDPSVVTLGSLTEVQTKTFSTAFGVGDADAFYKAIQKAEAKIYATRPQDLIELISLWQEKREIGSKAQLLEASISIRLRERDPDRDILLPLKYEDALHGAEMLSAAVTFQKKQRILVPEDSVDNHIEVL